MKAVIFVYSPTQFTVGSEHPVKCFEPGESLTYDLAVVAAEPETTALLPRGVYAIQSDGDDVMPAIVAGTDSTSHDIIVLGDKDKWPEIVATAEKLQRVRTQFQGTSFDTQLGAFLASKAI